MKLITMQHIPLASAYLCPDCNSIGNCAEQCPACASFILMGLAKVHDREAEKKPIPYTYSYSHARRRAWARVHTYSRRRVMAVGAARPR